MAYRGKIGFHFPGRGNPNIDTGDIKFLPAGITNPTSSDLVQIDKVYAVPAGVTITSVDDLQNYVVWEKVAGYVKYIMHFVASGSSDNNFTFRNFFINGTAAGSNLTNGQRLQYGDGNVWHDLESSIISAWQNGQNSAAYGHELKLWFTATNPTSFGVMGNTDYMQHTNFTLNIIGVDANDAETLLKTESVTLAQGQTYTINL